MASGAKSHGLEKGPFIRLRLNSLCFQVVGSKWDDLGDE